MTAEQIENYWQAYLRTLHPGRPVQDPYTAWAFGSTPEEADLLGKLVQQGIKTATCSLLWAYEADGEPLPQVGEISVILDGQGEPLAIIETTAVEIKPFNLATEEHAFAEGEGDRSLAYWRQVHWAIFSAEARSVGREASEEMPLVYERFQLLFAVRMEGD